MRRAVVATLALLLVSCDPLARTELRLTFDETGENVQVEAVADSQRVRDIRAASGEGFGEDILRARDEWSLRLQNAGATGERIILDRSGRQITRVEQRGTIEARNLQQLFFDTGVSAQITRGDGWTELTFYPGASSRATREQRSEVVAKLRAFSTAGAAYYRAVGRLYRHLDANPARSQLLFQVLFDEKSDLEPLATEEKDAVAAIRAATDALVESESGETGALARQADLVYNPFPARVDVVVPSEPLLVEGFRRQDDGVLVATTATPLEALTSLAGRWASPDPLAAALQSGKLSGEQIAAKLAGQSRSFNPAVSPEEIFAAITAAVQPAPRYRVRFVTRGAAIGH